VNEKKREYDLFTFVAGGALREGETFLLRCNCGAGAPITPPLSTEFVVCPDCMAIIKVLVLDGDPGYVIGQGTDGEPILLPVQGSSAKPVSDLTSEERNQIISNIKRQMRDDAG